MRVREMHPLCCITLESPGIGEGSPEPTLLRTGSAVNFSAGGSDGNAGGSDASTSTSVAGILYKWTNYGKGWRSRWFTLRSNGVLSYSKTPPAGGDVVVIGSSRRSTRKNGKTVGIVDLKISSFRESKSDERRFYIFTATKTLHLRTNSKKERVAWIEALISTRSLFVLNESASSRELSSSVSAHRLNKEQIMLSQFSSIQTQFQLLCQDPSNFTQLQPTNIEAEAEASGVNDGEYQLMKHHYTNLAPPKYTVWSTTESSDDVEKQELSDEEELHFFDSNESFSEPTLDSASVDEMDDCMRLRNQTDNECKADATGNVMGPRFPHFERRKKLPDPIELEKGVSLWSMIKDNIGKDLTRVCLPVYFNEPISSLQKCFEDLEYSHLLDQAYEHGKAGNSLMRILNVAAFAVSGYASSEGRHCKPFNPLLGETYEADYPEKGIRFFSEKVSHHPTVIACHCEGKGWKFWCDTNLKSKFWGRSIQLDPVGILNLEFDDGETFQWSKVTTSIYNLILGNIYCDHHGTMHIQGNHHYSCKLKFKEQSILDRNPHQVSGFVEDAMGKKVSQLFGKWDDSLYFINGEGSGNAKDRSEASLLWKRNTPPNLTRYNLTSFAITLNELTPGLKEKLPPTDSRLRPDQRHLENGEFDKANAEKLRLETRQRMSRKLQEHGWKPRWFQSNGEGPFSYIGGYWEAREQGKWDGCPDIFGEMSQELVKTSIGINSG